MSITDQAATPHAPNLPAGVMPDRQVATEDARIGLTEPRVGLRILIGNAGGKHQSPGSYGYTETTILAVETKLGRTGLLVWRLNTVAFGMGCWRVGDFSVRESLQVPVDSSPGAALAHQGRCGIPAPHAGHAQPREGYGVMRCIGS
jgi:hypothetical protein